MLDIDATSPYHPSRDPYALTRIVNALEPLGLTHYVPITSFYSGGLHLYFPFYQGQASWAIANAAALLEANSIVPALGQLETFPNARRYSTSLSDYNGHRLPLQSGSYLLDDDYQPVFTTRDRFVERWNFAENQNHVSREAIDRVLKQFERRRWIDTNKRHSQPGESGAIGGGDSVPVDAVARGMGVIDFGMAHDSSAP